MMSAVDGVTMGAASEQVGPPQPGSQVQTLGEVQSPLAEQEGEQTGAQEMPSPEYPVLQEQVLGASQLALTSQDGEQTGAQVNPSPVY